MKSSIHKPQNPFKNGEQETSHFTFLQKTTDSRSALLCIFAQSFSMPNMAFWGLILNPFSPFIFPILCFVYFPPICLIKENYMENFFLCKCIQFIMVMFDHVLSNYVICSFIFELCEKMIGSNLISLYVALAERSNFYDQFDSKSLCLLLPQGLLQNQGNLTHYGCIIIKGVFGFHRFI